MTSDWLTDAEIEALQKHHRRVKMPEGDSLCYGCHYAPDFRANVSPPRNAKPSDCEVSRLIAELRERRAHVCNRIWYARGEDGLIYQVEMVRPADPYTRIRWHVVNHDGEHRRWADEGRAEVTLLQPDERLEQLRIPTAIRQNAPQSPQNRPGGAE